MNIEKQTSYKCDFIREEKEVLERASNILYDLLRNMDGLQCNYADCTQYPDMPEGASFNNIENAKTVLDHLRYLKEIHG
jgi:hypothetical protein